MNHSTRMKAVFIGEFLLANIFYNLRNDFVFSVTESSDCSSSQLFHIKEQANCTIGNTSCTQGMYKCEQCGHMNTITSSSLEDGFIDSSQSIENRKTKLFIKTKILKKIIFFFNFVAQTTSVFQVSIDPESLELKNVPFPSGTPTVDPDSRNDKKRIKRLAFPGDVGDDEELGDESAQKYISVLRKTVMDQRKQTKTLMQQNRRQQQRINKLKSLLKELVEKTKNGNYVIEA